MKILFTGGSSFTGSRFIRELAAAGHEVTAIFRSGAGDYADEIRRRRVAMAAEVCRPVHGCSFGDQRFLSLIAEGGWDLLCHHAADVTNYKSPDFDAIAAVGNNTHNLPVCSRPSRQPVAAGCSCRGASSKGAREPARKDCPTSPLMGCPRPSPPRSFATTAPAPDRPRQVRHPQPVRPL